METRKYISALVGTLQKNAFAAKQHGNTTRVKVQLSETGEDRPAVL